MKHNLNKIVKDVVYRRTTLEKATGLMFKFKFENQAYIFPFDYEKKIPIHMLFVFIPIDVLWVNLDNDIVDLRQNALPFMPHIPHKGKACTLIELPKGSIEKHKIKLMDKIIY